MQQHMRHDGQLRSHHLQVRPIFWALETSNASGAVFLVGTSRMPRPPPYTPFFHFQCHSVTQRFLRFSNINLLHFDSN